MAADESRRPSCISRTGMNHRQLQRDYRVYYQVDYIRIHNPRYSQFYDNALALAG